jgi:hypothetical protein
VAANVAVNTLYAEWKSVLEGYAPSRPCLPHLAGGGSEFAMRWGKIPSVAIPVAVATAWIAILATVPFSHPLSGPPSPQPQLQHPVAVPLPPPQ